MKSSTIASILRWGVYAAALVPLVIFSQYISPFHFGKVVIFRSLVELMLVGYLILVWKDRSYLPRMNGIAWALCAFTGAFTLATITSILPYPSFWGSLERMGGLWTFWHYVVYFVILTSVMRTRDQWIRLFEVMLGVGMLSAFYGFLQRTDISWIIGSGNRERIFGTIGNPALFAGYQLVTLFLGLTLFIQEKGDTRRMFYGIAAGISALAVLMTVVRGSILALGVGLFVFCVLHFYHFRTVQIRRVLLGILGLVMVFGVVVATPLKDAAFIRNSRTLSRLTDTSFDAVTAKTRFWAWEAGLKGWRENAKTVLVGWGPENFNIPFSRYFNPKFFRGPGSETLFDRAHNMFVEILVTMGLLGLLAYLAIFGTAVRALWPSLRSRTEFTMSAIGMVSLIIAYVIHNSFIFDTSANFLVFFTMLGFISFATAPRSEDKQGILRTGGLWIFLLLILPILVLIYRTNILPSRANYALTRAIVRGWTLDDHERRERAGTVIPPQTRMTLEQVVAQYKEALAYDVPGKYEYRNRFAQYIIEYSTSHEPTATLQAAVQLAIQEVQKNADENSVDYLPELYLSRLNIILGKTDPVSPYNDEALRHSHRALELSPTFVRTFYEIGQAYLNKKDYTAAAKAFEDAARLNPEVGISYWYWGMVEVQAGHELNDPARLRKGLELAQQAIKLGYAPSEWDLQRALSGAIKLKDYPAMITIYERLVMLRPTNLDYYESLAVSYAQVGRIDDAVRIAREMVKIDANTLPSARAFVRELGREL